MKRRQTRNVLRLQIVRPGMKLPRRPTGVVLVTDEPGAEKIARTLRLRSPRSRVILESPRTAVRVHDLAELRRALLQRTPLLLLSPVFPTATHPDWAPHPRMQAATLARLAKRQLIALGGMNDRRYRMVEPLGFRGWAGIGAFRT